VTSSILQLFSPRPVSAAVDAADPVDQLLLDIEHSLGREQERRYAARERQRRVLGGALEQSGGSDCLFLHELVGPLGACGQIDHLAITPTGVWVIGAWREAGARVDVTDGQGERLMIRWRDKSQRVKCLIGQQEAVAIALAAYDVPVRGLLCFADAQLPRFGVASIGGFPVIDLCDAGEVLAQQGPVDEQTRREVRDVLARSFPAAKPPVESRTA
jgi:hypothetical protein